MSAFAEYRRVLNIHIKMQFSAITSQLGMHRQKRSGKETAKIIGLGLLFLYAIAAILLFYSLILFPFLRGAAEMGLAVPVMGIILLICMAVVLIFGTLTLISLVFGARDAEFYAALPLREQSVFAAKFTMVYVSEVAMSAVFLWPAVVIYGVVTHLSAPAFVLLILRALPVWLLLPAVPLAAASLLAMLFVRLTALSRHRDAALLAVGMIFMVVFAAGPSLLSSRMGSFMNDPGAAAELLSDNSAMLQAVTRAFPPSLWSAWALVGETGFDIGFGYLGLLASVGLAFAFSLLLSRRLYYKGVLAQLEAPPGKTKGFSQRSVKAGSPLLAFFAKEMKLILRTPVYAMNIISGAIIFPLMIAVVSFGGGTSLSAGTSGIKELLDSLRGVSDGGLMMLIAAGIVMLMSVMCVGVSTTFSREGNALWISQTVPVPVKTQVAARLLCGFAISGISAVLTLAILIAFLGLSTGEAAFGFVAGMCASIPMLSAAILPDALRPKRKWNSEAEAVKQNFNAIFAMLIDIGIAVAVGFAAYFMQKIMPVWATGILLSLACLAAGYALFLYASRVAENMMQTVDG